MKSHFKILICTLVFLKLSLAQQDYCASYLCPGRKHIACGNNGEFKPECASDVELIDISPFKELILRLHNEYRNQVAAGLLERFLPANRMTTMLWDGELESFATLNVKTCRFVHDSCRNSQRFRYTGQNMAYRYGSPVPDVKQTIERAITNWFAENKDASMDHINSFHGAEKEIAHFTVMVAEKNTRTGCAMMRQSSTRGKGKEYIFTCDYATTNVVGKPIYKDGETASACTSGKNPQYPALCHPSESISLNTFS